MMFSLSTQEPTECDLECGVHAALLHAFPWLAPADLKHQLTFTLKGGTHDVTINGVRPTLPRARLDVLVQYRGENVCVFELKRPGGRLTPDDAAQALSYAGMVYPRPPLVVLSNGTNTAFFETHTGQAWKPETKSEQAVQDLIANAAKVAGGDRRRVVEILLGDDNGVWVQAVRNATENQIDEMTGDWSSAGSQFVEGWGLARKATAFAIHHLSQGTRMVAVEGPPLAGKSHVLRELAYTLADDDQFAVLYVDGDQGANLFEHIADVLQASLGWPINSDEARQWVRSRSCAEGPALVIAVDNVGRRSDALRRDLSGLTTTHYGPKVQVVVALDDAHADDFMLRDNGRSPSALAKRAARVTVEPLDEEEFERAKDHLALNRVTFMAGARHSTELRHPWVLRAMAEDVFSSPLYDDANREAVLSPLPGLDLIHKVREGFNVETGQYALYRELAQAVLDDIQAAPSTQFLVRQQGGYVVRRDSVRAHLGDIDINRLIESGLLRPLRAGDDGNAFMIGVPQLLASEIAKLIKVTLIKADRGETEATAEWLAGITSCLFMGDVIAARALIDAAKEADRLDVGLLTALVKRPPTKEILAPGTKAGLWVRGLGAVTMTLLEAGAVRWEFGDRSEVAEADDDDGPDHVAWRDVHPWLILSHLAGFGFEVADGENVLGRADLGLLLRIGTAPLALMGPSGELEILGLPMHNVGTDAAILCQSAGIVEPITWSLFRYLGREWDNAGRFIEEVLADGSAALLSRVNQALLQLSVLSNPDRAKWAYEMRLTHIAPALKAAAAADTCAATSTVAKT